MKDTPDSQNRLGKSCALHQPIRNHRSRDTILNYLSDEPRTTASKAIVSTCSTIRPCYYLSGEDYLFLILESTRPLNAPTHTLQLYERPLLSHRHVMLGASAVSNSLTLSN